MAKLSENFHRYEFACRCGCGFDTVDIELITVLEKLRAEFKRPIRITSGARCSEHNTVTVKGSPNSQHLYGKAADIQVIGISPAKVFRYLDMQYPDKYGLGNAKTFTHIDIRDTKARWGY